MTRYINTTLNVEVIVTGQAQNVIGPTNVPEFVKLLIEMMSALGCNWAYVSRAGCAVEVHLHHKTGWKTTLKLSR